MTQLLDHAFAAVRGLTSERQDEIARLVLQLAADETAPFWELTPEEEASFAESFSQAERGEFATDEEIRAIWAKHGL